MIDVVPNAGVIALGKQGENQAVRVTLPNIRAGAGSILLLHQRSADQQPYPVPVVEADGGIIWTVSSTDTAYPGRGQAELQWLGADGAVIKSVTYQTNIIRALTAPGAVPDEPLKPYTQAVARDAQAAKDAAVNAAEAARSAEASARQAGLSADNAAKSLKKLEDGIASGDFRGEDGKDGKSAYQLAVDAGFDGTETQWLESLKGAPGDTTAADAAAEAAKAAAQEAQTAAEASAGSAALAAESVGGLADDLTTLKAENTALKASTDRTARSLDYLWKKSKGIVYDTETVTGTGSSVTVPSGAMEYAALRMVGGMSRSGRNLLKIDIKSVTMNGVTFAVDSTGRITVTGTTTTKAVFMVAIPENTFVPGETYRLTGCPTGGQGTAYKLDIADVSNDTQWKEIALDIGNGSTFSGTANKCIMQIAVYASYTGNGKLIFAPMISTDTTATYNDWEPYTDSLLDAPVDAVRVANASGDSTSTYPIPQAIRDLCPDYGQGTAESYNYIDFAAKAYYHVGCMTQDGTWTALATPEIIDLSAVWPDDDFGVLQVEAGGTINLHYPALDDGYELAVPSETEIMVDVAKVVQTNG